MRNTDATSCWNTIGVWSENLPTCDRLRDVVHCRNCDVYIRIGRDVFEKEVPNDYITQWTKEYSELQHLERNKKESVLVFRVANEWFGLPTRCFDEIVESKKIQRVPHYAGKILLGLINVRGEIRLCFSLKMLLGVYQEEKTSSTSISSIQRHIVVHLADEHYVFPVEEIYGVYRFDMTDYQPMPSTVNDNVANSLDGILKLPDRQVSCLNPSHIHSMIEAVMNE